MTSLPKISETSDLRAFLENDGLRATLGRCWDGAGFYLDPATGFTASTGIQQHLLTYHVYLALLGGRGDHAARAASLARHLASTVRDDGLLSEPDGAVNDHPASACHVVDALGTFCHYGVKIGAEEEAVAAARAALLRIVGSHQAVRLPEGILGRTQQLRFELRAWYWAWRITGEERYRASCMALWENGMNAYRNPIVHNGLISQASFHPDYTWNYACGAGTTTEYATNTHTPVYYCTEGQGFLFVYLHGRKDGVFPENPAWSEFFRNYILGLLRNLSRAGHTASDVDGYGIHRAWYSGCLVESVPVEAVGAACAAGLSPEVRGWFRWYVDRYVDFIRRRPSFAETGLPEQIPYGHHITIEKQFTALIGARFYSYLARGLYEYGVDEAPVVEPPALASYAWWHHWLRVSTARYETSLAGATSLCGLPVMRHFGDPNLGCMHGGSPLATLFSGNRMLYATSNDPEGLWHVVLDDVNGVRMRSCGSSFADETAMSYRNAEGKLLTQDSFVPYEETHCEAIGERPVVAAWSKRLRREGVRFFVEAEYGREAFAFLWGASFPPGNYLAGAAFVLPVPATLDPEWQDGDGLWHPLAKLAADTPCPAALRWGRDGARVAVALENVAPGVALRACVAPVSIGLRSPGGENSFCPFPLLQVRLEAACGPKVSGVRLRCRFSFSHSP